MQWHPSVRSNYLPYPVSAAHVANQQATEVIKTGSKVSDRHANQLLTTIILTERLNIGLHVNGYYIIRPIVFTITDCRPLEGQVFVLQHILHDSLGGPDCLQG